MTKTPTYAVDTDYLRKLADTGQFNGYGIKPAEFDPHQILEITSTTDDETIGDLIRGAWMLGALTGPAEPLFLYEEEPDSYYFRFDLGQHPARARLLTDGNEWRHISTDGIYGREAMVSVLEKMVDELNATLSSFDNYLTSRGVA